MSLRINSDFNGVTDPDAGAYIAAVEAADGNQLLEFAVGKAINDFVVGCKADGIWDAIKASCILAGARTTNGALIPLKGTAPTPVNFDLVNNTDYNRKIGLLTNASSKYIDTNRPGNADLQDNMHMSVFCSENAPYTIMGTSNTSVTLRKLLYYDTAQPFAFANNNYLSFPPAGAFSVGFLGLSRSGPSSYSARAKGSTYSTNTASTGALSTNIYVFAENRNNSPSYGASARASFYSIGESIDLAKLDARVTALINAFGAAIP